MQLSARSSPRPSQISERLSDAQDALVVDIALSVYPTLRPLYIMFFIEIVGWSMTLPAMAFFILKELGLGPRELGIQLSAFYLSQFVGSIVFGRCADAWGRKPIAVFCFFWASIGFLATALVRNFTELLITRSVAGLSGGTWPICQLFILDVVELKHRSKYIGLLAATFAFGKSVGPGSGAALLMIALVTRRVIFVISGVLCFLGSIIGLIFLNESLPIAKRRALCGIAEEAESSEPTDWETLNVGLVLIWIARFLVSFGEFFLYAMYAPLINDQFGFEDIQMGIILTCLGLLGGFFSTFVYPSVTQLIGALWAVILGALCISIAVVLLPLSTTLWIHICIMIIFCLGTAHAAPGFAVAMAMYCSNRHFGFANGWLNAFRGIAAVVAPFVGGWMYHHWGKISTFMIGGSLTALGGILLIFIDLCTTRWDDSEEKKSLTRHHSHQNSRELA